MTPQQYETWFDGLIPSEYPYLNVGWTAEQHGFGWCAYQYYCEMKIENMCEGEDAPELPSFKRWQQDNYDEEADNLGFSWKNCELCNGLPGERYAVTAWNNDNTDYIALRVCQDCLCYIANGDYPDYVEV